jgi:hypothetical protein
MAAAGRVSSDFNRLRDASWLSTGYTLGLCAAQPMVCITVNCTLGLGNVKLTNYTVRKIERYLRPQTPSPNFLFSFCFWMHCLVCLTIKGAGAILLTCR